MSDRDVEFAEFVGVTWSRLYRTTYAVAGRHALTRDAVQGAFAQAYADWRRLLETSDPESEVRTNAIRTVLTAIRKEPEQFSASPPPEFGPLIPQGNLICASPEERSRANDSWADLQGLNPSDRAAIAQAAATGGSDGQSGSPDEHAAHQQLVNFLVTYLDEVLVQGADLEAMIAQGCARKRRRRWIAGAVAATLVALVAIPVALFAPQKEPPSATSVGVWREAATSPLTPRWASVASWTGKEALFLGGFTDKSCQARSICRGVRDGAAYDPENDTWRTIAPAPFDIVDDPKVQIGDRTIIHFDEGWWYYDASDNRWSQIPDPPIRTDVASMTGMSDSLYVVGSSARSPIQVYSLMTSEWASLPPSQFQPARVRRYLVGTPDGLLVLVNDPAFMPANLAASSEFEAEFFDGARWTPRRSPAPRWSRLAPSGQKAHLCCWIWTGERLVHLERLPVYGDDERSDGVRFVGGMTLDTPTGHWGYLSEAPQAAQGAESWGFFAGNDADSGGPLVAFNGYVYDDRDTSWVRLSRPAQAPEAETAAVWADGRLIAFGGANFGAGADENTGSTNRTWIYTPRDP